MLKRLRKADGGDTGDSAGDHPPQRQVQPHTGWDGSCGAAAADAIGDSQGAQAAGPVLSPPSEHCTAPQAPPQLQCSPPLQAQRRAEHQAQAGPAAAAAAAAGQAEAAAEKPRGNPFARTGGAGKGSVSAHWTQRDSVCVA